MDALILRVIGLVATVILGSIPFIVWTVRKQLKRA